MQINAISLHPATPQLFPGTIYHFNLIDFLAKLKIKQADLIVVANELVLPRSGRYTFTVDRSLFEVSSDKSGRVLIFQRRGLGESS